MFVYIRLVAQNDTNGNPRRLCIVKKLDDTNYAERVAVLDEGYVGESVVRKSFPDAIKVGEFEVAPSIYRDWIKVGKNDVKLRENEGKN